jgi:hypothetical protein
VLFGEEIGELTEYEDWLMEYVPNVVKRKSYISGKDVSFATTDYCETANFISLDEVKEGAIEPLTINEIKDIDSIVEAISDKWQYAGNKILGNSVFVEASDSVMDSQYVSNAFNVQQSQRVFATYYSTSNKYAFGCIRFADNEFAIRSMTVRNVKRCFESRLSFNSSDIYFCCNVMGCNDHLFCFNQRNTRCRIGNLQLSKDRYAEIKKKILGEVMGELKKSKWFPSLFELVPNDASPKRTNVPMLKQPCTDMAAIEKAFSATFRILFKKDAAGIAWYESWLSRHLIPLKEIVTPFGSKTYFLHDNQDFFSLLPEKRVITQGESMSLGNLHLDESDLTGLEKVRKNLSKIAYLTDEASEGINSNIISTLLTINSSNTYKTSVAIHSENVGVCGAAIFHSKYVFGCERVSRSQFIMNCYNGIGLNRCFELHSCENCADSAFSHNCEGLNESMFCFDVKGKRCAIGNTPLHPEQYRKLKDSLFEQIADEILEKRDLKWDIYNIGSKSVERI